jgi:hypothetical protein
MPVQVVFGFHSLDLRQGRLGALLVTVNRNTFAAPGTLAVGRCHHDRSRFGAAATRNPEPLRKRPNFLACFDDQHDRMDRMFLRTREAEVLHTQPLSQICDAT